MPGMRFAVLGTFNPLCNASSQDSGPGALSVIDMV